MFEPGEHLSSDLEWMLQSDQVERELLLEALLSEFYTPTARLMWAWMGDESLARQAVEQAFAQALLEAHRYRAVQLVEVWFFRQALKAGRALLGRGGAGLGDGVYRAPDAPILRWLAGLEERARLPLLLHSLFEWTPAQIAAVLERGEAQVETAMQLGVQRLGVDAGQSAAALAEDLRQAARLAWPAPAPDEIELQALAAAVLARADRQAGRLRRFAGVKELALLGIALLMVAAAVWGADTFFPEAAVESTPSVRRVTATPDGRATRSSLRSERRATAAAATRAAQGTQASAVQPPGQLLPRQTPVPQDVFYTVGEGEAWGQIAALLDVEVDELLDLNRIPPGMSPQAGQQVLIPGMIPPAAWPTPAPPAPLPTRAVGEDLPDAAAVAALVDGDHFNALWVDARWIDFGPPGYIGPPQVYRMQVWAIDSQAIILGGPSLETPETVFMQISGETYIAQPAVSPWFSALRYPDEPGNAAAIFFARIEQVFGAFYLRPAQLQSPVIRVTGRETLLGAPVVMVEQDAGAGASGPARRLWIDEQRGLTLRSQTYHGGLDGALSSAMIVTGVAYDQPAPAGLFHPELPWRGGYAGGPDGRPNAWISPWSVRDDGVPLDLLRPLLPPQPAPPGFDPSASELTFQVDYGLQDFQAADLFAGPYFLASVPFSDPFTLVCDRSPDGRQFAFIDERNAPERRLDVLRWFSLDRLDQVKTSSNLSELTQVAFSPDGSQLAVFSASPQPDRRGLYLVDSQTGAFRRLYSIDDARSLVWRPDGGALAFIGRTETPAFDERVMVVDTASGLLTYTSSIDFGSGSHADWPTVHWETPFPVETQGVEECSRVVE